MKLEKVDISCFRSIKNASISLDELTAIVGENNAGKSAILRAINCIFNYDDESDSFLNKSHRYSVRSKSVITAYFTDIPVEPFFTSKLDNGKFVVRLTYNYSESKGGKKWSFIINNTETPSGSELIEHVKQYVDYVYVKANRGDDDLVWNESSLFNRIVTSYLAEITHKRDHLSKQAQTASSKLQPVFCELCKELASLSMLSNGESFAIEHNNPIDYSVFLQGLSMKISNSGEMRDIRDFGSGIKSVTVIALYRLLAKIKNGSFILGIEEPEKNLHPQAQRRLIASLKENRQEGEIQAIFATHSTVIVDSLKHSNIVLVRREADVKRGFHSKVSQLPMNFWQKHGIQEFQHENFFKVKNSDFFFAKYVVIMEGPVDAIVYEHILNNKVGDKLLDVSFIQLSGVKNLAYPYFLLKELEIPFTAIVDYDYFTKYKHSKKAISRDVNGFFEYQNRLNTTSVINDIWGSRQKKHRLRIL